VRLEGLGQLKKSNDHKTLERLNNNELEMMKKEAVCHI
jgi:uncharacterized membrane protein (DUF106 family)